MRTKANQLRTRRLYRKQRGQCAYCQQRTTLSRGGDGKPHPANMATIDHMIPRSRLKDSPTWNLVLACLTCNMAKGDRTPLEFFAGIATANTKRKEARAA